MESDRFPSVFLLILLLSQFFSVSSKKPPISKFPRQAPWCVESDEEPDLANFREIFDYHNTNPDRFVPVSPDAVRSPTGFINNLNLTRIYINTDKVPELLPEHPYRTFHNYFHITISADEQSGGMEGLFVQAIAAPLGVPVGEFIADFDCGDCGGHKTSTLEKDIAVVPCYYAPAASFIHPTIFSIGGKTKTPGKFMEAHFHFRYVDYPCFDRTFGQFLIIAVRQFKAPLQYEVFYSPIYKIGIEGVGAPFPMYYGFRPAEISCHDPIKSFMENWIPQRNQKAKIKYSEEYDKCTYTGNELAPLGHQICPPGPVTCFSDKYEEVPTAPRQWHTFREDYSIESRQAAGKDTKIGTSTLCMDCGEWEDRIGPGTWPKPPVIYEADNISYLTVYVTRKPIIIIENFGADCENDTEYREDTKFAKTIDGNRDSAKNDCFKESFDVQLGTKGYQWGQQYLLTLHHALLLFTWSVGSSCLIYCARFLKEASFAEKGSGCFGIGKWLWEHLFWNYVCFTTMSAGVFLMMFADMEALCSIYDKRTDEEACLGEETAHKVMGSLACFLFFMGFVSGWVRPKNRMLRDIIIYYHAGCGYIAKYLGLCCMLVSRDLLSYASKVFVILMELSFIGFFIAGTVVQRMMDKRMLFRVRDRRNLPVPEGIDTFSDPPMKNVRALLFPFLMIVQLACYSFAVFNVWEDKVVSKF